VSDYPARDMNGTTAAAIRKQVENGARFLMIGGWASFNAKGNNYYKHPLSEILPVILSDRDDRLNVPQGLVLFPDPDLQSQIFLNWNEPPVICGYNQALPVDKAQVLVWMKAIQTDGTRISLKKPVPLVIKSRYGKGTVLACLTDLAPHWCGGLVDWGSKRLVLPHVEIGDMFLLFIQFLLEA
jgi:uncharacterized membrane protein